MTDTTAAAWKHLEALAQPTLAELFEDENRVEAMSGRIEWRAEEGVS